MIKGSWPGTCIQYTRLHLYTLTLVVLNYLSFLVWNSSDPKDKFSFYAFIMNNKVLLYLYSLVLNVHRNYMWFIRNRGRGKEGMRAQLHLPVYTAPELCAVRSALQILCYNSILPLVSHDGPQWLRWW